MKLKKIIYLKLYVFSFRPGDKRRERRNRRARKEKNWKFTTNTPSASDMSQQPQTSDQQSGAAI
ncbi:hypothetical protein DsansV1_C24g0183391 [Dioscorea sansibarensis]